MIKKILPVPLFCCLLFVGCGNKHSEVFARITERKHLEDGKLHLSYSFLNGGKLYKGDTTINNMVIPNDSVPVILSEENPAASKLRIP